jgi:hypothetical protein
MREQPSCERLGLTDVAVMTGATRQAVDAWRRRGLRGIKLPTKVINGRSCVKLHQLDRWLRRVGRAAVA